MLFRSVDIYLPSYFQDVDNAINEMLVEVLNLANATYQVINGETLRITPDNGFKGSINDLIVKLTDPGNLYAESNQFLMQADSVRTSNNGIIHVQFEQGVAYEVNGLNENALDENLFVSYTLL